MHIFYWSFTLIFLNLCALFCPLYFMKNYFLLILQNDGLCESNRFRKISKLMKSFTCKSSSTKKKEKICNIQPDPPENCHLTVKKLPKTWHFFKKIAKIFHFFQKNCQWKFFSKKLKFLAIFWHSNGNFPEGQLLTELVSQMSHLDKTEPDRQQMWQIWNFLTPSVSRFCQIWQMYKFLRSVVSTFGLVWQQRSICMFK